jgi:hypothetical protein
MPLRHIRLSTVTYCPSGQFLNNNPNHTKIAPFHVPANSSVNFIYLELPKTLWSRTVVEETGRGDPNCTAIRGHSFPTVVTVHTGKSAELASAYLQVFPT